MKNILIITLAICTLSLTFCGSKRTNVAFLDPLNEVRKEFESRGIKVVNFTPINFGPLNEAGTCHRRPWGNWIEINEKFWNSFNKTAKKYLLAHEIGHCMLDRDHDDEMIEFHGIAAPKSIMHSTSSLAAEAALGLGANEYYFDELLN